MITLADYMNQTQPGLQLPVNGGTQQPYNDSIGVQPTDFPTLISSLMQNQQVQNQGWSQNLQPAQIQTPQMPQQQGIGDMALAGNPGTLSGRIQQWLGAQPKDEGGQVQDILSGRFQAPLNMNDVGIAAQATAAQGQYVPAQQVANQRLTQALGTAQGLQGLQTSQLDLKTKQNVYATQIMSAAAASGDQNAYNQGLHFLQQNGIDISSWAPDVATGKQQADAARLAQSPFGSLANVATKMDQNNIALNTAQGKATDPNDLMAARLFGGGGLTVATNQNSPPVTSVGPTGFGVTPAPVLKTGMPQFNQTPTQTPTTPVATTQTNVPIQPKQSDFNDPTKTQAANQAAFNDALEAWKSDPAVIAATSAATTAGKDVGAQPALTAEAQEIYGRVSKNLDGLLSINQDVPSQGMFLSADAKAALSQRFGNLPGGDQQAAANNYNAFTKVNKAQILNGIQELVDSGSIRNSKSLIQLVSDVNAIDVNASPASRAQQIMAVKAELQNLMISKENISADLSGGTKQPYTNIPMTNSGAQNTAQTIPDGATATNSMGHKVIYKGGQWQPM